MRCERFLVFLPVLAFRFRVGARGLLPTASTLPSSRTIWPLHRGPAIRTIPRQLGSRLGCLLLLLILPRSFRVTNFSITLDLLLRDHSKVQHMCTGPLEPRLGMVGMGFLLLPRSFQVILLALGVLLPSPGPGVPRIPVLRSPIRPLLRIFLPVMTFYSIGVVMCSWGVFATRPTQPYAYLIR